MRLLFWWRRKMNGDKSKEIQESQERLKETQQRWPEVRRAERNLDELIQRSLRGGKA